MTGRTPAEAVRLYRNALQRALACVTRNVLRLSANANAPAPARHELSLSGEPVPLPGEGRIALWVRCRFVVVTVADNQRLWQARTMSYFYTLSAVDGPEILAYHWHPFGRSPELDPHLHLGAGAQIGRGDLVKAHLPTGHVSLPDVLRLTIRDLGVRPLRADWERVLDAARAALQ